MHYIASSRRAAVSALVGLGALGVAALGFGSCSSTPLGLAAPFACNSDDTCPDSEMVGQPLVCAATSGRNDFSTERSCLLTCPSGNGCPSGQLCSAGFQCIPRCDVDEDCKSGVCSADGVCTAPSCADGIQNGKESDVDCGGICVPCADGLVCSTGNDCASVVCNNKKCVAPSCTDRTKNALETDVDCGGPTCAACIDGKGCLVDLDCADGTCALNLCAMPTCTDLVRNGGESDVDCGGSSLCPTCDAGKMCSDDADCSSETCSNNHCACAAVDDACSDTSQCCTGNYCDLDFGACQQCIGSDDFCETDDQCCSGTCNFDPFGDSFCD